MAELVGAFAASHAPLIARNWEHLPAQLRQRLTSGFRRIGKQLSAARPDVLIVVAPDHWVNFFLDNLPSVCIGVGDQHVGPPEPFMKTFPREIAGHAAFARHLASHAFKSEFEPSLSHRLTLDHGFCIPLQRFELPKMPMVVPIIINDLEPPMISIRRCVQWGHVIAEAINSFDDGVRIAIVASGGLSHSIGEATMGTIDGDFDERCLRAFGQDEETLIETIESALQATGNGAHEVRNWVIAHAAAKGRFELIDYVPSPEVYVGCAFAEWIIRLMLE